jgi:hypothetical protein
MFMYEAKSKDVLRKFKDGFPGPEGGGGVNCQAHRFQIGEHDVGTGPDNQENEPHLRRVGLVHSKQQQSTSYDGQAVIIQGR